MWKVLALATTSLGILQIISSVANVIVVESAREHLEIGFWDYARFGIPITILATVAATFVLLVLRRKIKVEQRVNCPPVGRGHCHTVNRLKPPLRGSDAFWRSATIHRKSDSMMGEWKNGPIKRPLLKTRLL